MPTEAMGPDESAARGRRARELRLSLFAAEGADATCLPGLAEPRAAVGERQASCRGAVGQPRPAGLPRSAKDVQCADYCHMCGPTRRCNKNYGHTGYRFCARCQGFRGGGGGSSKSSSSGIRSESRLEGSLAEEKRAGEAGTCATFGSLGPGV